MQAYVEEDVKESGRLTPCAYVATMDELKRVQVERDHYKAALEKISTIEIAPNEMNGLVREIRGIAKKALHPQTKPHEKSHDNDYMGLEAFRLVYEFFGNVEKAKLWMSAENPLLGGIAPMKMVQLGRGWRLVEWIKTAIAENGPHRFEERK